jgi:hypothetical protein
MLRAGFKLHSTQIVRGGHGRGFAEHGRKQAKK